MSENLFVRFPDDSHNQNEDQLATVPNNQQGPKKKLKCININVQGIKGLEKQAAFHAFIAAENPDVIMGTESHLDSTYTNNFP